MAEEAVGHVRRAFCVRRSRRLIVAGTGWTRRLRGGNASTCSVPCDCIVAAEDKRRVVVNLLSSSDRC